MPVSKLNLKIYKCQSTIANAPLILLCTSSKMNATPRQTHKIVVIMMQDLSRAQDTTNVCLPTAVIYVVQTYRSDTNACITRARQTACVRHRDAASAPITTLAAARARSCQLVPVRAPVHNACMNKLETIGI